MKVKVAKSAGFCMGVRRALEIVLSEAHKTKEKPLYTFGPLIHNRQVLALLESKGVKVLQDPENAQYKKVVIRAHGIPPEIRSKLRCRGAEIIDATCPRVARVQAIIKYYVKKGYKGIIVGDANHPEVVALKGYGGPNTCVVCDESELSFVPIDGQKLFVVAQTTQNAKRYEQIAKKVKELSPDALIFNTICEATHQRQKEVKSLAEEVDAVVVVGGYESANTKRLVEIVRSTGKPALHVETPDDLDTEALEKLEVIGVTAGASTPNWLIKDVVATLQQIQGKKETFFSRTIRKAVRFLVLSNLAAGAGAASLCYCTNYFLGSSSKLIYPLITFLYIYAMHVLNRFLDRTASAYSEPERASFLRTHGKVLAVLGAISTLGAIGLSLKVGLQTFLILVLLSLLGVIYSLPIIPRRLSFGQRYRKIKDIPCSKTISEAVGWTTLIVIAPLLQASIKPLAATAVVGACVFLLAFVRASIFDILQLQGDLIAGSETLPIVLGESRTVLLLKVLLAVAAALVCIAQVLSLTSRLYLLMLIPLGTLALSLWMYQKAWKTPGLLFEALIDACFVVVGVLVAIRSFII